jgi:hypothetical protein
MSKITGLSGFEYQLNPGYTPRHDAPLTTGEKLLFFFSNEDSVFRNGKLSKNLELTPHIEEGNILFPLKN